MFVFLAVTVAQSLGMALPYLYKQIVDNALVGDAEAAVGWALMYPILVAIMYVGWRASGFVGLRVHTKVPEYAHNLLFEYTTRHSDHYFANRFAGTISTKINRAADRAESMINDFMWHYYPGLLQLVIVIGITWFTTPNIAYVFVVIITVLFFLNGVLVRKRRPLILEAAEEQSKLTGFTVDAITNIRAVHQFARRLFEVGRVKQQVDIVRQTDMKQWQAAEWILLMNSTIITVLMAIVLYMLVGTWQAGEITTGDLVMILSLMTSMLFMLNFIGNMMNGFIKNYGDIQEGLDTILLDHELVDETHAHELSVRDGNIHFDAVDFAYDAARDVKVFANFELTIPAHQKVGLVGASGAGKTTFVSLLLRQHDVTGGAIKIDGQPIHEVTQESLRNAISVVPQEPMLFHRSLMENIRYGRLEATDEEVVEAARMAQAHDFILETKDGYETLVGERGVKLSGGQRQRIAIARAILKNAPILILDEATSALDSESEVLIQQALHALMEGKTVIAIAHRLSTLREMDRIIVMESGNVVEDGTHKELSQAGGVFQKLWEHQAGGFLQE